MQLFGQYTVLWAGGQSACMRAVNNGGSSSLAPKSAGPVQGATVKPEGFVRIARRGDWICQKQTFRTLSPPFARPFGWKKRR